MKRTFFLTCLFLMACLGMQAQNLQVSGTVISKSDDLPVIGATVLEKGTTMVQLPILTVSFLSQ